MNELRIVKGTLEQYNTRVAAVAMADETTKNIHNNTIYFIMDVHRIYIGNIEFSRPTECVTDLAFIVNNADVHAITKLD